MSEYPEPPAPAGSYRLRLHAPDAAGAGGGPFGFAEAAALAPYLMSLGVSHVHLSPVLRAAPDPAHGDGTAEDAAGGAAGAGGTAERLAGHARLSDELGGLDAFRAMAARFHAHGLGVLVDVVPHRRFSDVPAPHASRRTGPGGPDDPGDPDVFERAHAPLLRLVEEGLVDGLRIDHPDGLADPRGYLERLAEQAPDQWILVERITAGEERLPDDWPCAGTTGYDSLCTVGGLFVDPGGEKPLTDVYVSLTGGGPSGFDEIEYGARRHAAMHGLRSRIERLHRSLCSALGAEGARRDTLERVLVELLASMPVHRAYLVPGEPAPAQAVEALDEASRRARTRLPDELHGELAEVVRLALGGAVGNDPDGRDAARREFAVRFQQTSAPLAAKGVHDTAFARWNRMAMLNEVGGDPGRFAVSPDDFHAHCARLGRDRPSTMTALSSHETRRQEDVRARLAVLAELPGQWAEAVARWRTWWDEGAGGDRETPLDPDLDYLMWQTLVGAWPLTADRLATFLVRAAREAGTRTRRADPDRAYEQAVLDRARRVLGDAGLTADVAAFVAMIEPYARANTLGQKLVQLTMPGVPDVYQGCELAALALGDPGDRRPVDHGWRRERLHRLDTGRPPRGLDDEKLLITSRALRLRREHPGWYGPPVEPDPAAAHDLTAEYEPAPRAEPPVVNDPPAVYLPLAAQGPAAGHVVAFWRGSALTVATRLPAGLERRGGWGGTSLDLGHQGWRDMLTGALLWGPVLDVAEVLERLPVALLVPKEMR